ncbi:MAG: hypothetical protein RIR31_631 [Bacteroidota bacterium]|jgi:Protein of unknown function (DUF1573)
MKKYFLFFLIPAALLSCDVKRKDKIADDSKTDSLKLVLQKQVEDNAMKNTSTVQIIDSVYNFGTITEGEKVEYSYRFKNTGTNPLVIFNATASCGCTVPEKPEKPILPGETGFIKVVFNSNGKRGHNEKDVNITSNANPAFPSLKLIGEIKEKQ